jgi:uncharacterized membrane protein YdjX (TVP38/TMEM64 family)|tara:strand:+ start:4436 stop:5134 length:699 start_codon:yes stop_codon:yes gene_type:complete
MKLKINNLLPVIFILILFFWIILMKIYFKETAFILGAFEYINTQINSNFLLAIIFYSFLYIVCVAFSVPVASYLTLIGGAIFNWLALPVVVISATIGATIIFILSKSILANYFSKKIIKKYKGLEKGFSKNHFYYLLFLRLIPFAPFFIVNILAGIVNMRIISYVFATFIGIIPGTTIYIFTGITFSELFQNSQIPEFNITSSKYFLIILLLSILSLSPIIFDKFLKKKIRG